MLSLIIEATKASDKIMRQRYVDFSTEPLAFYKEKLRTARSREHREALAELISKEEEKLMFASKGKHFIAEPYINPTISLYPTAPKPTLILALSLSIGIISWGSSSINATCNKERKLMNMLILRNLFIFTFFFRATKFCSIN